MVGVEMNGQVYELELVWSRIGVPRDGWAWWPKEVHGEPRPTREQVAELYRRAIELAELAMRSERSER